MAMLHALARTIVGNGGGVGPAGDGGVGPVVGPVPIARPTRVPPDEPEPEQEPEQETGTPLTLPVPAEGEHSPQTRLQIGQDEVLALQLAAEMTAEEEEEFGDQLVHEGDRLEGDRLVNEDEDDEDSNTDHDADDMDGFEDAMVGQRRRRAPPALTLPQPAPALRFPVPHVPPPGPLAPTMGAPPHMPAAFGITVHANAHANTHTKRPAKRARVDFPVRRASAKDHREYVEGQVGTAGRYAVRNPSAMTSREWHVLATFLHEVSDWHEAFDDWPGLRRERPDVYDMAEAWSEAHVEPADLIIDWPVVWTADAHQTLILSKPLDDVVDLLFVPMPWLRQWAAPPRAVMHKSVDRTKLWGAIRSAHQTAEAAAARGEIQVTPFHVPILRRLFPLAASAVSPAGRVHAINVWLAGRATFRLVNFYTRPPVLPAAALTTWEAVVTPLMIDTQAVKYGITLKDPLGKLRQLARFETAAIFSRPMSFDPVNREACDAADLQPFSGMDPCEYVCFGTLRNMAYVSLADLKGHFQAHPVSVGGALAGGALAGGAGAGVAGAGAAGADAAAEATSETNVTPIFWPGETPLPARVGSVYTDSQLWRLERLLRSYDEQVQARIDQLDDRVVVRPFVWPAESLGDMGWPDSKPRDEKLRQVFLRNLRRKRRAINEVLNAVAQRRNALEYAMQLGDESRKELDAATPEERELMYNVFDKLQQLAAYCLHWQGPGTPFPKQGDTVHHLEDHVEVERNVYERGVPPVIEALSALPPRLAAIVRSLRQFSLTNLLDAATIQDALKSLQAKQLDMRLCIRLAARPLWITACKYADALCDGAALPAFESAT